MDWTGLAALVLIGWTGLGWIALEEMGWVGLGSQVLARTGLAWSAWLGRNGGSGMDWLGGAGVDLDGLRWIR